MSCGKTAHAKAPEIVAVARVRVVVVVVAAIRAATRGGITRVVVVVPATASHETITPLVRFPK